MYIVTHFLRFVYRFFEKYKCIGAKIEKQIGGYDVVGTKGSEKAVFGSFKSQKQVQAVAYAMTLGMGAEGLHGLVTLSENLSDGVDLGEAAVVSL